MADKEMINKDLSGAFGGLFGNLKRAYQEATADDPAAPEQQQEQKSSGGGVNNLPVTGARMSYQLPRELIPEGLWMEILKRETPGLTMARRGAEDFQDAIQYAKARLANTPTQVDWTPVMKVADAMFGLNTEKAYTKPLTKDEQSKLMMAYDKLLMDAGQGLTKTELEVLKNSFQPTMGASIGQTWTAKGAGKGKGLRPIPATVAKALGQARSELSKVRGMFEEFDAAVPNKTTGWFSGMKNRIKGSSFARYFGTSETQWEEKRAGYAKAIASAMESGRISDKDTEYYLKLLPASDDTVYNAISKLNRLERDIQRDLDEHLRSLEIAKFDVRGYQGQSDVGGAPSSIVNNAPAPTAPAKRVFIKDNMKAEELKRLEQKFGGK